jgi:hypothetical protein
MFWVFFFCALLCAAATPDWDCQNNSAGNYTRAQDCHLASEVILEKGTVMSITGRSSITKLTAKSGSRHFRVTNSKLELRLLNLNGGGASTSGFEGGSVFVTDGQLKVVSCIFSNNYARAAGGAVYCVSGAACHMGQTTAIGNKAGRGGAIYAYQPTTQLILTNVVLSHNEAINDGGALYVSQATANLTKVTLVGNKAKKKGGGIYGIENADIRVRQSAFSKNIAQESGASGRQIWLRDENTKILLVNTVIKNHVDDKNNIVIPMSGRRRCDTMPCNIIPFVGACSNMAEYGVLCKLPPCPIGHHDPVTEDTIGEHTKETCVRGWDGVTATGNFNQTTDCALKQEVNVRDSLEILGRPNLTVISANKNCRHFSIQDAAANLTLRHLNLTGGFRGIADATKTQAEHRGGSLFIHSTSGIVRVIVFSCLFQGNQAWSGGSIFAQGESLGSVSLVFVDTDITGNVAKKWGGGVYIESSGLSSAALTRSKITANSQTLSDGGGGGIFVGRKAVVTLRESMLVKNKAQSGHHIMSMKAGEETPTVTLINTGVISCDGCDASDDFSGQTSEYVGSGICGKDKDNDCNIPLFTGECINRSKHENRGVVCDCGDIDFGVSTLNYALGPSTSCRARPNITLISPTNGSTAGLTPVSLHGINFGKNDALISVSINSISCVNITRQNSTWITALSPPGIGISRRVQLSVDGVHSNDKHLHYFHYDGPNITDIISPPYKGGILLIKGSNFGVPVKRRTSMVHQLVITVDDGSGCGLPCTQPWLLPGGDVQCSYHAPAKEFDRRGVVVSVNGRNSKRFQYTYAVDRGQLSGLPGDIQTIAETKNFSYKVELTLPPRQNVSVILKCPEKACKLYPTTLHFKTNSTMKKEVTIQAIGNDVDEGTDELVHKCFVSHVLETNDMQYINSPDQVLEVHIINSNEAGANLWPAGRTNGTITYDYPVKYIGPLCNEEGRNITYGIRLDTKPVELVVITPNIVFQNTSAAISPPRMLAEPKSLHFDESNWGKIQQVKILSIDDDIDNGDARFRIFHSIETNDEVYLEKATKQNMIAVVDVSDDDTAGLLLDTDTLRLNENGDTKGVILFGLSSQPTFDVKINIQLDPYIELVGMDLPLSISKETWKNISQNIRFRALRGAPEGNSEILLHVASEDTKYDKQVVEIRMTVISIPPQAPNAPARPVLRRTTSFQSLHVDLIGNQELGTQYEVQWSHGDDNFATRINSRVTAQKSVVLNTTRLLPHEVVYVRVRELGKVKSPWSLPSEKWVVASSCDHMMQFLSTSGTFSEWKCLRCPPGSSCVGRETLWSDVLPLFGWWRNSPWSETARSNFTPCQFPPACLGAVNSAFQGQYKSVDANGKPVDASLIKRNESCNIQAGYANICDRDEIGRCRLCATCRTGYRRRSAGGAMRCDKCPSAEASKLLLGIGALIVVMLLGFIVYQHMEEGGKQTLNNLRKIIILNYFQVTYMIANMDIPWPGVLRVIFDIEGAISTIGEHLLNPACEMSHVPAADIVYQKQVAYMLAVPIMIYLTKHVWTCLAWAQGRVFRYRGPDETSPSHKDGSVATVVFLLYFMYPTLCNQAFALLICKEVDGKPYLTHDLQEECYTGRHLLYVCILTIPQILLYVIGIPLLGLRAATRATTRRMKMAPTIALFRYGMLYSGYNKNHWYWGAVIACRKAIVSLLTSVLSNPGLEVHWITLFLSISIMANMFFRPYKGVDDIKPEDTVRLQSLDTLSLFVLLITAWSGMFFNLNESSCEIEHGWCFLLLIIVCSANAIFFGHCVFLFREAITVFVVKHTMRCKELMVQSCLYVTSCGKIKCKTRVVAVKRTNVHLNPLRRNRALTRTQVTTNPMLTGRNANHWSTKEKLESRQTHLLEMATLRRHAQTQRSTRLKHLLREKNKREVGNAITIPKTPSSSEKDKPGNLGGITNVEIPEGVSTRMRAVSSVNKMIEHFENEFSVASNNGMRQEDIMKTANPMFLAKTYALERKKTAEEWGL